MPQNDEIRKLLEEALEAAEKTQEYAGDWRLLDYPGWSWADWQERVRKVLEV